MPFKVYASWVVAFEYHPAHSDSAEMIFASPNRYWEFRTSSSPCGLMLRPQSTESCGKAVDEDDMRL